MPPLKAARQSHHHNESIREAAFHKGVLRETGSLSRTSYKEQEPAKRVVQISRNGREVHNADSRLHEHMDRVATKPPGCFSCFLLPVKRAKDVSASAISKSSRDKIQNASKASPMCNNSHSGAVPLSQITNSRSPVIIGKPLSDVTIVTRNTMKSGPISMSKPQAVSQSRIKASSMSMTRPQVAQTLSPIGLNKPHRAPTIHKTSSKPTPVSLMKPHLAVRASSKSSPPMNISHPQSAETLGNITRKSSPLSPINGKAILETHNSFHKQNARAFHLHKGPRPMRSAEPSQAEKGGSSKKRTDMSELANQERRVVWREGLLQRLGRLHGLGNCKLSLEELIELDDTACLDEEIERVRECAPPSLIQTQAPSSSTRPSIASTWNMEFEGGKPILPLQRQDVSPELVHCVWPFSHTNCLFEASRRHHGNYT